MDDRKPPRSSASGSSSRPSSRPSTGRPSSSRPSSSGPATGPNKDRRREDLPARGGSSERRGATRNVSTGREVSDPRGFRATPQDRDQSRIRPRIFEPDIPDDVTGE